SRLFVLAALIARVRTIKRIVFLRGVAREYVGNSAPTAVAATLAKRFPWLEEAYLRAQIYIGDKNINPPPATPEKEIKLLSGMTDVGRLQSNQASMILSNYLYNVRGNETGPEWVNLGAYIEHAEWLTPVTIARYLATDLERYAVQRDPASDASALAKTLL